METALTLSPEQAEHAAKEVEALASTLLATSQQMHIATVTDYEHAGDLLKQIKGRAKAIEEQRVELTKPINQALRKINDLFGRPLDLLKKAEAALKSSMLAYQQAQERKRREEELRLQELARKEEARLRKLAEAKAVKAEAKGETDKAEEIRESVQSIPVPTVQVETPKVAGISTRTIYRAEVFDLMALLNAVVAGVVPTEAILPNDKYLSQTARALKDAMKWPGVRVLSEDVLAAGGR